MRKRDVDVPSSYWPKPLQINNQVPSLDVIRRMSAAVQESRSFSDIEDNYAKPSPTRKSRGRTQEVVKNLPRQANVLFIPGRTSSRQMQTVKLVKAEEVPVGDEQEETAFTVSRTVTRSASRSTSTNEGREEGIGVRTWVGAGGELVESRRSS